MSTAHVGPIRTLFDQLRHECGRHSDNALVYIPTGAELVDLFERAERGDPVALRHVTCIRMHGNRSAETNTEKYAVRQVRHRYFELARRAMRLPPTRRDLQLAPEVDEF